MRTRVVAVDPMKGPWPALAELGRIVREGGLVAFPTETVYGIAVNAQDPTSLRRLQLARGRGADEQVTIHLASSSGVTAFLRELPRPAAKLANRFWPGPLTLVVADRHGRPQAFRVPDMPVTREFLRACDCRVGGVGAGPAPGKEAVTAADVLESFDGLVDAVIDAGPSRHAKPSTAVRVVEGRVDVIRAGALPEEEIREVTARTLLFVCTGNRCRSPLASAFATELLARNLGVEPTDLLEYGWRIESAGTGTMRGQAATPEAEAAARAWGLDLTGHRSRPLTPTLLEEADEVFVMTADHRRSILEFAPDVSLRLKLLDTSGRDIPDPYGGGEEVYRRTAARIRRILQERLAGSV